MEFIDYLFIVWGIEGVLAIFGASRYRGHCNEHSWFIAWNRAFGCFLPWVILITLKSIIDPCEKFFRGDSPIQ